MKIDVPFELGDPVIVIDYNQHDGYWLTYHGFNYRHIPEVGKTVFGNAKEANEALSKLNQKFTLHYPPGVR